MITMTPDEAVELINAVKIKTGEKIMTTKKHIMPAAQKQAMREMDSQALCDFQNRLQVECGMTHRDSADYIAQAFED